LLANEIVINIRCLPASTPFNLEAPLHHISVCSTFSSTLSFTALKSRISIQEVLSRYVEFLPEPVQGNSQLRIPCPMCEYATNCLSISMLVLWLGNLRTTQEQSCFKVTLYEKTGWQVYNHLGSGLVPWPLTTKTVCTLTACFLLRTIV